MATWSIGNILQGTWNQESGIARVIGKHFEIILGRSRRLVVGGFRSLMSSEWNEDEEYTKKNELVDSTFETASQKFPFRRQLLS